MFQNTVPFNEFELEFEVRQMPTEDLDCSRTYPEVPRIIECDTGHIMTSTFTDGFDQAMVVSDIEGYGGAAGTIPVISSSSPSGTMLHEYMHVLGFCDEYHYLNQQEADLYCRPSNFRRYINATVIEPLEGGYSGDEHARSEHADDIPWYSHISSETPIATSELGTPAGDMSLRNELGLFESATCEHATEQFSLWKPGSRDNIMRDVSLSIGNYAPIVREALQSLLTNSAANAEPKDPEGGENNGSSSFIDSDCPTNNVTESLPLHNKETGLMKGVIDGLEVNPH
jgi:hypothetical protein